MKSNQKRLDDLKFRLNREREFMASVGTDLAGYIQNYHVKHERSVENAEAIYRADRDIVVSLEKQIKLLEEATVKKVAVTSLKLDDYYQCRDILEFFDKGTASGLETHLISALVVADKQNTEHIRKAYPMLVLAFEDKQKIESVMSDKEAKEKGDNTD